MLENLSEARTFQIDMEPVGRRVTIGADETLLDAAQAGGVELAAVCGGVGLCGKCRVRLMTGQLTPPQEAERQLLPEEQMAGGVRLACQCHARSDVKLHIPPESLMAAQRLQIEAQERAVELDPPLRAVDLALEPPSLNDLRADTRRLSDALRRAGVDPPVAGLPVLRDLSDRLRAQRWQARLALREAELVSCLPPGSSLLGLAVDVGTTKLAVYLVDLETGDVLARTGATNPQVSFGEDVLSRIAYANEHENGRDVLQTALVERLNELSADLCRQIQVSPDQIGEAVLVGNTAMHHLFAGLPVQQLGFVPYVPAVSESLEFPAHQVGLRLGRGSYACLPPNIAGFVGADHVSMLLAIGILEKRGTVVAIDIGTNTEISLLSAGRLLSCSCASGPAFEGAHIRDGMRAVPGAIERVKLQDGQVFCQTVEDRPAVGICGSGILDAIAEMYAHRVLNSKGRFLASHPRIRGSGRSAEFVLVAEPHSGHGRAVSVTPVDVQEIQLAKGAIRAGLDVLLREAGIDASAVDEFVIAGAFGTYLDIESAMRIGMFPELPLDRFQQVGNAAGRGAQMMLTSKAMRARAGQIVERVQYVELTTYPGFSKIFAHALSFK
jgi:uncharacterized 2Fe-2S/4Fe-4S cluster protein (DUF4445 family)